MTTAISSTETKPLVLHFGSFIQKMSDDDFYEFCRLNDDLRLERTADGDLIIMPPTGGITGIRNFALTGFFHAWVEADGSGLGFDSSTAFRFPSGAQRSPDVAWVKRERWDALSEEQQEKFPPLCPDFVIELRSRTDSLTVLRAKMEEYIANGAKLGLLIDPMVKKVYIYRPGLSSEILDEPTSLSDPFLPGLRLPVDRLWKT